MAYEYQSHWVVQAPVDTVWAALTEVETWPLWWPFVRSVQTLRRGDESGLGAIRRIAWASRLPYGFTLDVECTEVQRLHLLRGRSRGHLEGEGVWTLHARDDAGTDVRYTWRLALNRPWMKLAAPLMAPVFRWNHEGVMRGGEQGLARHLAQDLMHHRAHDPTQGDHLDATLPTLPPAPAPAQPCALHL